MVLISFTYLFKFVLLNVSLIQIRQSGADNWSETLKVQQTAIYIILYSSPLANSDTELNIEQLLSGINLFVSTL